MSSLLEGKNEKSGTSKIFIVGAVLAVLAVGAIITAFVLLPSPEEEKQAVLEDAYRSGDPKFEEYSKDVIVSNDPKRLIEAYTGLGDIVMKIGGRVRNRGDRVITGLEMSVGMVNTKNELIKDKKVLVIPSPAHPELKPDEVVDVGVTIPGFEEGDDRANARWKVTAIRYKE